MRLAKYYRRSCQRRQAVYFLSRYLLTAMMMYVDNTHFTNVPWFTLQKLKSYSFRSICDVFIVQVQNTGQVSRKYENFASKLSHFIVCGRAHF